MFNLKKLFGKKDEYNQDQYDDLEAQEEEEYYIQEQAQAESEGITPEQIAEYERLSGEPGMVREDQFQESAEHLYNSQQAEELLASVTLATPKGLFEQAKTVKDLKVGQNVIEELLLKHLYILGEATSIELAQKLRVMHNTVVNPVLMDLANGEFVHILGSSGIGGHNKAYALTERGRSRVKQAFSTSNYLGPVPVHLDDYIEAVAQYDRITVPPFEEFREFYKEMIFPDDFMQDMAVAMSSGEAIFLYGTPGMGKTSFVKQFIRCTKDSIKIPFAVYIDGNIIQFYDKSFHETVDEEFDLHDEIPQDGGDHRWIEIHRPCVLVGTEFSAQNNTNIQYSVNGASATFPVTTKANGGMFVLDDFGRQIETPDQILNLWIGKLEGASDVMTLKTGQQFTIPYNTLTVFTTNLEPHTLLDDAFLRRLSYKIQVPDISLEHYCVVFALEAERNNIEWQDSVLEHLVGTYYQKGGQPLAADHPRGLLSRVRQIAKYAGQPEKTIQLSKELVDRAWEMHFIEEPSEEKSTK